MPDDRAPAPLQDVLDFVNTRNVEDGADEIADAAALQQWLAGRGLLTEDTEPTEADVAITAAIREELRAALLANHEAAATPTVPTGDALSTITFTVGLDVNGIPLLRPAQHGIRGALGTLLQPLPAAAADGSWARAKVCPSDTCLWAFYDQSRNRSRRWCSMEVCGNREKSRTFRQRQDQ